MGLLNKITKKRIIKSISKNTDVKIAKKLNKKKKKNVKKVSN